MGPDLWKNEQKKSQPSYIQKTTEMWEKFQGCFNFKVNGDQTQVVKTKVSVKCGITIKAAEQRQRPLNVMSGGIGSV